jgi:predicted ArsR family transcriptional regulator
VALAEFLVPVKPSARHGIVAQISKRFQIAPLDAKAAHLAAMVYSLAARTRQPGQAGGRELIKADCLIVAAARACGATVFYSHDADCRAKAKALSMAANDLPDMAPNLFAT